VPASAVVAVLDPCDDFAGGAVAGGPKTAVLEIRFQRLEEAFGHCVNAPLSSIRAGQGFVLVGKGFQHGGDFACEVPFEAADNVSLAFSRSRCASAVVMTVAPCCAPAKGHEELIEKLRLVKDPRNLRSASVSPIFLSG
jgi:hypothetical protein